MNINQHNHLLYKIVAIDRSFDRVSARKTEQDILRIIATLVTELHDTQRELAKLKKLLKN